jgi:hypothetical protein
MVDSTSTMILPYTVSEAEDGPLVLEGLIAALAELSEARHHCPVILKSGHLLVLYRASASEPFFYCSRYCPQSDQGRWWDTGNFCRIFPGEASPYSFKRPARCLQATGCAECL